MNEVYHRIHYYRYLTDIKKYGQDYFTKRNIRSGGNYYGTPIETLKNKAINEHHIKKASNNFKIKQFPVKEIKIFLKENNLKLTGKKEILVNRITENVDEETINSFFTGEFYELTGEGSTFLENNKHIDFENWHWLKIIYEEIIPFEEYENSLGSKCLLIMDKASSHISKEAIIFLEENNITYNLIPSGLIPILKPLDISVNKIFKDNINNLFEKNAYL